MKNGTQCFSIGRISQSATIMLYLFTLEMYFYKNQTIWIPFKGNIIVIKVFVI